MSDWMHGPHVAQRTADLEVTPDPDPVELTDPVDVVAWLRALPVGTVLLDREQRAWQLRQWSWSSERGHVANWAWYGANTHLAYNVPNGLTAFAAERPFRVLWMPGGAT